MAERIRKGMERVRGSEESPKKEKPTGIGTGIYRPRKLLTTFELGRRRIILPHRGEEQRDDRRMPRILTAADIERKIGVEQRRIAGTTETVAYMGYKAGEEALGEDHKVDLIITSTTHPTSEHVSKEIAKSLKLPEDTPAIDVHAACSGSALAFAYLHEHREEMLGKRILVVASEKITDTLVDLRNGGAELDPSLGQTIFSDGAAAIAFTFGKDIKTHFAGNESLPDARGRTDLIKMSVGDSSFVEPCITYPVAPSPSTPEYPKGFFTQEGGAVYEGVQSAIPDIIRDAVKASTCRPEEIDLVVAHSGSKKMVEALKRRLGEYKLHALYKEGNVSSVSMLYALIDAIDEGLIGKGSKVVLSGFGAGSPDLFSSTVVAELG